MIFERNPHWDGKIRNKAMARPSDYTTSHEAAAAGNKRRDMFEVWGYIDALLARGQGIISTELFEYIEAGILAGRIDARGLTPSQRANSLRRRFSDFCPRDD